MKQESNLISLFRGFHFEWEYIHEDLRREGQYIMCMHTFRIEKWKTLYLVYFVIL